MIASAILDRILHHAVTISIRGDSYRLKDKLKSGVVKADHGGNVSDARPAAAAVAADAT